MTMTWTHTENCHSRRVGVCSSIMAEYAGDFIPRRDIPAGTNLPLIAHVGGIYHNLGKALFPALIGDDFERKVIKAAGEIPLITEISAVADTLDRRMTPHPHESSADVLAGIKAQAGRNFFESALVCLERAWPRLMIQYKKWGMN